MTDMMLPMFVDIVAGSGFKIIGILVLISVSTFWAIPFVLGLCVLMYLLRWFVIAVQNDT